jgi:hypothetical protein
MRKLLLILAASSLAVTLPAAAADPPPVRLVVKPLLCVLDHAATACMMNFDIRWKSMLAREYCLNDSAQSAPLHCWANALTGALAQKREVGADFVYWLGAPSGAEHLAEVKIGVLRVDSADRRRERRSRHVWDVL